MKHRPSQPAAHRSQHVRELSLEQRRALRAMQGHSPATPETFGIKLRTMLSLERRGLVTAQLGFFDEPADDNTLFSLTPAGRKSLER